MIIDIEQIRRARTYDIAARGVITIGGVSIIVSVILILVLIVGVTLPLFLGAQAKILSSIPLPKDLPTEDVVAIGVDEFLETAYVLSKRGEVLFFSTSGGHLLAREPIPRPSGSDASTTMERVDITDGQCYAIQWSDQSSTVVRVVFRPVYAVNSLRTIEWRLKILAQIPSARDLHPLYATTRILSDGWLRLFLLPGNIFYLERMSETEHPITGVKQQTVSAERMETHLPGTITAIVLDRHGENLYAGIGHKAIARWRLNREGKMEESEIVPIDLPETHPISALTIVFGDISLAVGDRGGGLSTWFCVRNEKGESKFQKIHVLPGHLHGIRTIRPSQRRKSLLSLDEAGIAQISHMTSERCLLRIPGPHGEPLRIVEFAPRENGMIGLTERRLTLWHIENPHPEVSWKTLFGKVWYEGYPSPVYCWQSSAANEDFEPKLSLTPLIFGTLKGTIYAMLFAAPLALLAAIYVSQFTSHEIKKAVKPTIEIMAAIPSVVIGFLIALWLAPVLQGRVIAVFASFITIPVVFLLFLLFWQKIRTADWAKRIERGYEFLLMFPILILGFGLATLLAPSIERWFFGGNFLQWLFETRRIVYDQRNCMIIAFGLGFAVIPIIFSISEDALTNVPRSLSAASLALGASRWQTVRRIVLPSASPGIFAAVMIGFGRAVGETMIVLMATGNTAIMDWSIFNGMRTLSANIAVEIPEAPVDGTLYRVLFLCAVILFAMTFVLNTLAEVVRHRLRKKYGMFQ